MKVQLSEVEVGDGHNGARTAAIAVGALMPPFALERRGTLEQTLGRPVQALLKEMHNLRYDMIYSIPRRAGRS